MGDNVGLESSVGIVIDGVYRPRNGVGFGDLGDVDRIEVLKGPQGTLFGKSTSAGVINILTAQPSFDFGAHAEFTAGNYGEYGGSASVTGPLMGDKLAGSLYIADRQRDGFNRVISAPGPSTQTRDQTRDFYTIRGQLLWLPTDDLSVRTIVDFSHRNERCCDAVQIRSAGSGAPPVGETAAIVRALGGAGGGEAISPDPVRARRLRQPAGRAGHPGPRRVGGGQLQAARARRRQHHLDHLGARLEADQRRRYRLLHRRLPLHPRHRPQLQRVPDGE